MRSARKQAFGSSPHSTDVSRYINPHCISTIGVLSYCNLLHANNLGPGHKNCQQCPRIVSSATIWTETMHLLSSMSRGNYQQMRNVGLRWSWGFQVNFFIIYLENRDTVVKGAGCWGVEWDTARKRERGNVRQIIYFEVLAFVLSFVYWYWQFLVDSWPSWEYSKSRSNGSSSKEDENVLRVFFSNCYRYWQ